MLGTARPRRGPTVAGRGIPAGRGRRDLVTSVAPTTPEPGFLQPHCLRSNGPVTVTRLGSQRSRGPDSGLGLGDPGRGRGDSANPRGGGGRSSPRRAALEDRRCLARKLLVISGIGF